MCGPQVRFCESWGRVTSPGYSTGEISSRMRAIQMLGLVQLTAYGPRTLLVTSGLGEASSEISPLRTGCAGPPVEMTSERKARATLPQSGLPLIH